MESSDTGGVKPFSIGRRMVRERERLLGMTDEERAWRAQFLKDQILAPDEPGMNDAHMYVVQKLNPIRRFYRAPLDKFGKMLEKPLGQHNAAIARWFTGKIFISIGCVYAAYYYFKYNQNDWTRKGGWRVISSRPRSVPGDPNFPNFEERTHPSDYANRGFKNSPI